MNRKFLMYILAPASIFFSSLQANATIIEGFFHGTVLYADNHQTPSPYHVNNFWSDDILGKSMDGHFTFSTDLVPGNSGLEGDFWEGFNNSWLRLSIFVDGKTLDISKIPEGLVIDQSYENFSIGEPAAFSGLRVGEDYFEIVDFNHSKKGNFFQNYFGALSFIDETIPIYDADGNIQSFSWVDKGESFDKYEDMPAIASFNTYSVTDGSLDYGTVRARVNDFKLVVHNNTQVPEPSSIVILMLGFCGLLFKRMKR